ncbi:MAG: cytidylate kinase-like family protein [Chloroflexota bacterium]
MVITLSRQLASGGTEIATQVAKRLRLQYVDREIIFRAAKQAGVPEAALAEVDEFGILPPMLSAKARRSFISTVETVIRDFAKANNTLIVGRGSQVILNEWPDSLHLQVIAPFDLRVERLMKQQKLDREAAVNRLLASDKARTTYIRRHYHVDWLDSRLYDLVINTGKIRSEDAVELVILAAKSVGKQRG